MGKIIYKAETSIVLKESVCGLPIGTFGVIKYDIENWETQPFIEFNLRGDRIGLCVFIHKILPATRLTRILYGVKNEF